MLWKTKTATKFLGSESSSSSSAGSSGGIGGDGGDVFNSSDLEAVSGEGSDGRLSSGSGSLGLNTTSGSEFDVHGVDSDALEGSADIHGSEHSYKHD